MLKELQLIKYYIFVTMMWSFILGMIVTTIILIIQNGAGTTLFRTRLYFMFLVSLFLIIYDLKIVFKMIKGVKKC